MKRWTPAGAVLLVLGLSACGGTVATPPAPTPATAEIAPAATVENCQDGKSPVASFLPRDSPSGARIAEIRKRGRLIVGTSADAPLWGATDITDPGGDPAGFDAALAARIAADLGVRAEYRVLPLANRQQALNTPVDEGGVDLVAERMTITCARWQGSSAGPAINFSTTYYTAKSNGLLVRAYDRRGGIKDFKGQPVCGVTGSSSLAAAEGAGARIVEAPSAGQCLVKFIQGEAEAVIGDDTTLTGLKVLDPETEVVGAVNADVPYGLGTPKDDAFTAWVNAKLADYRSDGTLARFGRQFQAPNPLPDPVYGRS